MSPELIAFLREFGLPLTMMVVLGYLLWKGHLVIGSSRDREVALLQAQLEAERKQHAADITFREGLRLDERTTRLATEDRLERATVALEQQATLIRDAFHTSAAPPGQRNG